MSMPATTTTISAESHFSFERQSHPAWADGGSGGGPSGADAVDVQFIPLLDESDAERHDT